MDTSLPVVESFHSLQGEGVHTGRSAFFIRLAQCKVGCPWCDTKTSWSANDHPQETVIQLSEKTFKAKSKGAAFVVITGGEPLHHDLNPLCEAIRETCKSNQTASIPIHLETSGVDALSGNPDWITLSPKRHAPPRIDMLMACDELKVIVHEENDILFAEKMAKSIKLNTSKLPLLFLQAGWNSSKGHQLAFDHVRSNQNWRLSMQTHKWLKIN